MIDFFSLEKKMIVKSFRSEIGFPGFSQRESWRSFSIRVHHIIPKNDRFQEPKKTGDFHEKKDRGDFPFPFADIGDFRKRRGSGG